MEERTGNPLDLKYDYEDFKNDILRLTGINLHAYKEKQMKRRINTLIGRKGYSGYADYMNVLTQNSQELHGFMDYITINVTEFFRTIEHWAYFESEILKELSERNEVRLKIWSCACSTGEEPYSVVMSLAKYLPLEKIRITATDIDDKILSQAAAGIFSERAMGGVPDDLKQKYFTCTPEGLKISDEIRNCVEFRHLDLIRDDYPTDQNLIICRNVLIYFTEETKDRIYQKFHDSLGEGGYLFTGNTEQIIQYKRFGFEKNRTFIYQRAKSK